MRDGTSNFVVFDRFRRLHTEYEFTIECVKTAFEKDWIVRARRDGQSKCFNTGAPIEQLDPGKFYSALQSLLVCMM